MNSGDDALDIRSGPAAGHSSPIVSGGGGNRSPSIVDVGTPRHPMGWSTTTIRYHNFPHLPCHRGDSVDSDPFPAHGLDWYLRIHPGGAASAHDDMTSLYLRCKSAAEQNVAVQAEFSLALLRNDGQIDSMMSCPCNAFKRKRKGWPNFISRDRVLDRSSQLLDGAGTLTVIVKIQLFQERDAAFVPRNHLNLLRLLQEANSSPVEVGRESGGDYLDGRSSTADTSDVKFSVDGEIVHAHRLILKLAAPTLAYLCEDADDDTAVPVVGVRSKIFHAVLRFVYGDVLPEEIWMTDGCRDNSNFDGETSPAMELLDAANRFGVVGLKILAETKVAEGDINNATASDLILYADSKDCPLLLERCVDYFVANAEEVRAHPSFRRVRESADILDTLMEAYIHKRILRSNASGPDDVQYDNMGVNLLRRKLDERGLDVDGSREMLVQRLRTWDARRGVPEGRAGSSLRSRQSTSASVASLPSTQSIVAMNATNEA